MTIKRMNHVSIVVDLPAAIAFFTTVGISPSSAMPVDPLKLPAS